MPKLRWLPALITRVHRCVYLQRDGRCVQVNVEPREVEARRTEGAELGTLWPLLGAACAPCGRYRKRAAREIPVVVLEPTSAAVDCG